MSLPVRTYTDREICRLSTGGMKTRCLQQKNPDVRLTSIRFRRDYSRTASRPAYCGATSALPKKEGTIRLYPTLGFLHLYIEIEQDDIVDTAPAPKTVLPHDGTIVWVRSDADVVVHGDTVITVPVRTLKRPRQAVDDTVVERPSSEAAKYVDVVRGRLRMSVPVARGDDGSASCDPCERNMSVRPGAVSVQTIPQARPLADDVRDFRGALEYQAPFLIEKLLKEHIVESAVEGETLFTEVKRYLVLTRLDRHVSWQMYSTRVDEVWHQFVLFTREYGMFCDEHLGGFAHHRPSNAPELPWRDDLEPSTFRSFRARYREDFGQELQDCWMDERNITLARRLINDKARRLFVVEDTRRYRSSTKAVPSRSRSIALQPKRFRS